MILVDVYVPAMNKTYDFQLDENVPVRLLTDEIAEILQKKAGEQTEKHNTSYILCAYDTMGILQADRTLRESGIKNGSRLFII